jgi:hypothetical protein
VAKVYIKTRTKNSNKDMCGYSIDIDCYEVFLTDYIKNELEKLSALALNLIPEIEAYRLIKEESPLLELKASQVALGNYKVKLVNPYETYMTKIKNYNNLINILSKAIIERIVYLFNAFSIENY